jgi:uncharacterized protein (TIGR02001 family)
MLRTYHHHFQSLPKLPNVVAAAVVTVLLLLGTNNSRGLGMSANSKTSLILSALALSTSAMAMGAASGAIAQGMKDAPAAEEARTLKAAFNFGVTSDYIFRGVSQNARNPAVQGGVDLTYGIAYAGLWASAVKFGDHTAALPYKASAEVDFYAGIKPVLKTAMGEFNFDLGAIYYAYPGAADSIRIGGVNFGLQKLDYYEFKAGVNKDLWKDGNLATTIFFSPNSQYETGKVWTSETTFTQTFAAWGKVVPAFSSTFGYQKGDTAEYKAFISNGASSYMYGNAGVSLTYDEKISLDLRYWDTNIKNDNSFCTGPVAQCSQRAVATLKFTY